MRSDERRRRLTRAADQGDGDEAALERLAADETRRTGMPPLVRLRVDDDAQVRSLSRELAVSYQEAVHLAIDAGVYSLVEDLAGRLERVTERLGIYTALSRRVLAGLDLSEGEASLICDALNGAIMPDRAVSPSVLRAEIADAISLNGLDRKWDVDGVALLVRMERWGVVEAACIADAVAQFWQRTDEDSSTALREIGLVQRGAAG